MSTTRADNRSDAESGSITMLEFSLGSQRWCMRIEQVVEILQKGAVTPMPNTPPHVEGVTDLRGQTTTVINPSQLLDVESESSKEMVIILENENGDPFGWLVDDVYRVEGLSTDALDESVGSGGVRGVFAEDEHVIWVEPNDEFEV